MLEFQSQGVFSRDKCFLSCDGLAAKKTNLLKAACQTGCDRRVNGIDTNVVAQLNFDDGFALFEGDSFHCSQGGSVQQVFEGNILGEDDCREFCASLDTAFVIDDFDLAKYSEACDQAFADDYLDEQQLATQQGCVVRVLFRTKGATNFRDQANHFCGSNGDLFSLQAIQFGVANNIQQVQTNECVQCCTQAAQESGIGSNDRQLGCNPTADCGNATVEADCEIGRSLAKASIGRITVRSEITCLGGNVERFIDLNELAIVLSDEEIAAAAGGTIAGVLLLSVLALLLLRLRQNRMNNSVQTNT